MFYVYAHRFNDQIIYVGKGRKFHPFSRQNRNKAWRMLVGEDDFKVEILAKVKSEPDALDIEAAMIAQLKPTTNVRKRGQATPLWWPHSTKNTNLNIRIESNLKRQLKREAKRKKLSLSEYVSVELKKAVG